MIICPVCGWSTRSAAEMVGHMSRHEKVETCKCNPRKHGEFFVRGRLICIYCRKTVEK